MKPDSRIEAFHNFKTHAWLGKDYKKLKAENIKACEEFIAANDSLSIGEFEYKCNRWMIDQEKPKVFPIMWGLVSMSNTSMKK